MVGCSSIGHMRFRFVGWFVCALVFSSVSAFGQFISAGVKAGVPLNDGYQYHCCGPVNAPSITTNRYVIGPEVEVRLPFHLGLESDALYRHYNVNGSGLSQWEFPVLLKYRFKGVPLLHPFADAGPIFNYGSSLKYNTVKTSDVGFVLGAGVDFHALLLHITPEFRYIHWSQPGLPPDYVTVSTNQNQSEFLVGFTF